MPVRNHKGDPGSFRSSWIRQYRYYDGVQGQIASRDDLAWHFLIDQGLITPVREILRILEKRMRELARLVPTRASILGKRKRDIF